MFFSKILSFFIFIIIRLLSFTYRFRYDQNVVLQNLKTKKFILAIWHQNLLPGILAQTGKSHIVIISKSKDATPVALVCQKLGHLIVRGSSAKGINKKGGQVAKDEMIEFLKKGFPGAITVDGPKGPAFEVKPGIIDMAKKSDSLIIPYSVAISSYWQFSSWDQFRFPKPFSKILISYGGPIEVFDENKSFADYQILVAEALKSQSELVTKKILNWDQYSKFNWFV